MVELEGTETVAVGRGCRIGSGEAGDDSIGEKAFQYGSAKGSSEVAAALSPVDAAVGVAAGPGRDGENNAAIQKGLFSRRGEAVVDATTENASFFNPTAGQEGIGEGYSGDASQVGVAGAGLAQEGVAADFAGGLRAGRGVGSGFGE